MQLITSVDRVEQLCSEWLEQPFIAIDTEFMRTDTYYADLALVQINAGSEPVLIDPTIDGMAQVLAPLLSSETVVKVMHSGSEDLQILSRYCAGNIGPVFDTQIAAAFLGYGFSLAYRSLVAEICEVTLDKGETRSNWLQRPLTPSQMKYAADDVVYLSAVYQCLYAEAADVGRLEWVQQECQQFAVQASAELAPEDAYSRFGRAWQLRDRHLLALQKLSAWRECTAVSSNKPRSWILKDKSVWDIAAQLPADRAALERCEEMAQGQVRRYADEILALVDELQSVDAFERPEGLLNPAGKSYSQIGKQLRATVKSVANELQLAPEVLARKKDLEYMLATHARDGEADLPERFEGWREDVIGERLQQELNQHFA